MLQLLSSRSVYIFLLIFYQLHPVHKNICHCSIYFTFTIHVVRNLCFTLCSAGYQEHENSDSCSDGDHFHFFRQSQGTQQTSQLMSALAEAQVSGWGTIIIIIPSFGTFKELSRPVSF